MRRRDLLASLGVGASLLAGCHGVTGTPHTTSLTSTLDGRAGPARSCSGEYSAFKPGWVVEGPGPLGGFDLTLAPETLSIGETLTARLRNVTTNSQTSGNKRKFDVQYRDSDGWRTIFGRKDNYGWTDEGIGHKPDHGFTWQFAVTRDGLSNIADTNAYRVCDSVDPGTYRFVFWGITTEREKNEGFATDYALGVPFTVTEG